MAQGKLAWKKRAALIRKKLHKMQSAVQGSSDCDNFLRGKKGMTKFQAICRRNSLVLTICNDKILKGKVLKLYGVQLDCTKQHRNADKEYHC